MGGIELLLFLRDNWDSALIVVFVAVVIITLIAKKQWGLLGKILFGLVTCAEREFGGNGTGALKLAAVVEKVYPLIPSIIRVFITEGMLIKAIEGALELAKLQWEKNPKLIGSK